jgi:hypothetical protein
MASAATVLGEWASLEPEKEALYAQTPSLLLRWLNEAQLRFCSKSEILQGVWSPSVGETGIIALPSDFLRELVGRVKASDNTNVPKGQYQDLQFANGLIPKTYCIWNNNLYLFPIGSGTLTVPYIKKPALITVGGVVEDAVPVHSIRSGTEVVTIGLNTIVFKIDNVPTPISGSYELWLEFYDSDGNIIDITPTPTKTSAGFSVTVEQNGTLKYGAIPST